MAADVVQALDGFLSTNPAAQILHADPAPPSVLVIFGAGGDLTRRLLMPALYNLAVAGLLPDEFRVRGVDMAAGDDAAFRERQTASMGQFLKDRGGEFHPDSIDQTRLAWLADRLTYQSASFDDPATFEKLKAWLGDRSAVFYLAVADRFFGPIIDMLGEARLVEQTPTQFRRVVIEKPFGHDLPSAIALNARILKVLSEDQIYRIDHFLGKETVQNIMALRFSNGMFEPLWNRDHIEWVEITAAETVGVEKRARFYEPTGAMRDMVPNHIFQLLAMTAMEPPNSFDADAVRSEKAKVVEAIRPLTREQARSCVERGQYSEGRTGDTDAVGYRAEPGVDPESDTETYVAIKFAIDNWRWAGVPFYVRTGKRMAARKTEIVIHFRPAPFALFRDTSVERMTRNILTLHIQPTEGVSLTFSAKVPGPTVKLNRVTMDMRYGDYFKTGSATGYETLLYDVLIGDATLFQRADNIEAGWRAVQPILDLWRAEYVPVELYPAGSAGPVIADTLTNSGGQFYHFWSPLT